ncbi:hypothetical protein MRX96_013966 [Rhipicephalus microplus]
MGFRAVEELAYFVRAAGVGRGLRMNEIRYKLNAASAEEEGNAGDGSRMNAKKKAGSNLYTLTGGQRQHYREKTEPSSGYSEPFPELLGGPVKIVLVPAAAASEML